jgi:hypothetical protein
MALAILSAAGGRTKTKEVFYSGGTPPTGPSIPDPPEAIHQVSFNEPSGTFNALPYNVGGAPAGGIEYRATGITTGSTYCAGFDGQAGTNVLFPHNVNWSQRPPALEGQSATNITDFTWNLNFQADTLPAEGGKMVIAAKDRPGMPSGISWELRTISGTTYLYLYVKDSAASAVFVLDSGDAQTVSASTAVRATLTWEDGVGCKIYVGDSLINTEASCDIGLYPNDASIVYGDHNNGGAPFDGLIDDSVIYDGAMSLAEVQALDDAQNASHGSPPPAVDVLACLSRSSPSGIDVTLKDLGTFTDQQYLNAADGPATKYDARGSTGVLTWNGSSWSNQFFWRLGAAHDGGCVSGMAFRSNITTSERWGAIYLNPDGGQIYIRDQNCRNFAIGAFRGHGGWDPIRFGYKSGGVVIENVTLHDGWLSLVRDDAIENDLKYNGLIYKSLLIDGCFSGYSYRSSANGSSGINTIQDNLIRLRPMHYTDANDYRHGMAFKLDSTSPQLIITDMVIYLEKPGFTPDGGNPLYDLVDKSKNNLATSGDNNRVIWGGSAAHGSYSSNWGSLPTGWTVEEESNQAAARALWESYRTAWITARSDVPTLGSPYDDIDWTT